jgi:hypothetical protein
VSKGTHWRPFPAAKLSNGVGAPGEVWIDAAPPPPAAGKTNERSWPHPEKHRHHSAILAEPQSVPSASFRLNPSHGSTLAASDPAPTRHPLV